MSTVFEDVFGALNEAGVRLPVEATSFADPGVRRSWVRDRNLRVFSLHHPDRPVAEVDLFAERIREQRDG